MAKISDKLSFSVIIITLIRKFVKYFSEIFFKKENKKMKKLIIELNGSYFEEQNNIVIVVNEEDCTYNTYNGNGPWKTYENTEDLFAKVCDYCDDVVEDYDEDIRMVACEGRQIWYEDHEELKEIIHEFVEEFVKEV